MSRQILFCVESNNKARTDYQYIEETLKRFYKVDRKIRYRAIYLGSKTKYNAKDKVREINKNIKTFIKKNKLFSALIVMAIIIALVAIFAPVLAPYSPYDAELSNAFQAPSSEHLFGTDKLGRDVLSRVIYGTRISLSASLILVVLIFSCPSIS